MQNRLSIPPSQDNSLWISWYDSPSIPLLNPTNIMDYFQDKTNPFYDHTCNNEVVKMQRLGLEQMNNMIGFEYILLHVQAPILYVIRKQHRHSPTETTPIADYYIIAGYIYQAPDLASMFNSRLLSITQHLQSAFEEASSYSRYNPNKGYSWDFSSNKALSDKSKSQTKKEKEKVKEEPSSLFQRQRVDMLLGELLNKFPLPMPPQFQSQQQQQQSQPQVTQAPQVSQTTNQNGTGTNNTAQGEQNSSADLIENIKIEPKQEPIENPLSNGSIGTIGGTTNTGTDNGMEIGGQTVKLEPNEMKPPPEKKMKL